MRRISKLSILLTLLFTFSISCSKDDNLKNVDDVCTKMEDSNFMKYCYDNFDVNKDGKVSMQEAAAVLEMRCADHIIYSMKGIEYFTQLKVLYCGSNFFTSLDVSKNKQLKVLDCNWCELTYLDISKNTLLEELDCSDNHLTSLDVSKNTQLVELCCEDNNLTSLDVSKNTLLEVLDCSYNNLTSLDIAKNIHLEYLDCSHNNLTSLDVSQNIHMSSALRCSQEQTITAYYSSVQSSLLKSWEFYSPNVIWKQK